jgi:hypothetical protein
LFIGIKEEIEISKRNMEKEYNVFLEQVVR